MTGKNRYSQGARISERKFRQLLRLFSEDLMAVQIARLTGVSRVTVNRYLSMIRDRIAEHCQAQAPFSGTVEVDESYFGARRVKGRRGRGAFGKTIVFGIYKRNGKVYTEIVPNITRATLLAALRGKVSLDSVVHSDGLKSYDGLVDLGYRKHYRVDHSNNEFATSISHINGIEGFWGLAKTRLAKFKGMHKHTFYLHLKECEFRYNHRDQDIYRTLLKMIKQRPLNLS